MYPANIPPGLRYLAQNIPKLFVPPAVVYAFYYVATVFGPIKLPLPTWLKAIILVLSTLLTVTVKNVLHDLNEIRESRAMGAIRIPLIPYSWPGGLDILLRVLAFEKAAYLGETVRTLSQDHGQTYRVRIFFEDKIFTTEPEFIKAMLATECNNWVKGSVMKDVFQTLLGDGVFNSDGEMWKFHRSMTRPFFSKERISYFGLFGRHTDQALNAMKQRLREGYAVDFQDLAGRFTLDVATDFLFGHCVNVLSSGLPYSSNVKNAPAKMAQSSGTDRATRFADAFALAQEVVASRGPFNSAWPLAEFWQDKTEPLLETINSFIDPIIKEAVQRKRLESKPSGVGHKDVEEDDTLLCNLVQVTDDINILRDEILNMLIASRDTIAATLTFAVYCLAMYPDSLKKLRGEILKKVGLDRNPHPDDLREMRYLRAFIKEVLRLYPAVPFNQRSNINPTTITNPSDPAAKPWYIPRDTRTVYSVFLMHRRKDLWGPDAEKFDPDRFLDSRVHKYLTPRPFIFLPFNAGPRICLGQQFAFNEISFFLVRLLQRYSDIVLDEEAQPAFSRPPTRWRNEAEPDERKRFERVYPKCHLTLYCLGGLWVRMTEAPANESI